MNGGAENGESTCGFVIPHELLITLTAWNFPSIAALLP